jgi:hypothetical protein
VTARFASLRRNRIRLTAAFRKLSEEEARAIQAATERLESGWVVLFNEGFRTLGTGVNAAFSIQVARGNEDGAMNALAIAEFRNALGDGASELYQGSFDAAAGAIDRVTPYDIGFDPTNEDVLRIAAQRSGTMVTGVTNETTKAIRGAVRDAIERGDNARVAARSIRPLVGVLERHRVGLDALRRRLIERGALDRDKIDRIVARRAEKLLTYRTEMIARTETLWSANTAQQEYWIRLRSAGLIPPTAVRVWIVTDDDRTCDQCYPMDGQVAAIVGDFRSEELGQPGEPLRSRATPVEIGYPPLHPMCRCVTGLEFR